MNTLCRYCIFIFLFVTSGLAAKDFVVGTTSGYAPYVSLDESGNYVGFDIDIAKELSKRLNRTLVLKDFGSMPSLLLALKQKKVDAVIWAVSITEERKEKFAMIYYQGQKVNKMPVLFFKEMPQLRSIEDIQTKGLTVSVEAGSYQESCLEKSGISNLKRVDKVLDAILQIKYGKADLVCIDSSLVDKYIAQCPGLQVQWVALDPALQAMGNGICVEKTDTALISEIEQVVIDMQQDNTIALLEKKYALEGT
jgi:arginine transport system substrate-binding protein